MTGIALPLLFHFENEKGGSLPVHRKKKRTITNSTDSTPLPSAPALPEQQEFYQHLRDLARGAMRTVLEAVMRSSEWGEERAAGSSQWYRNGYCQRDLVTTSGRIEESHVPRDCKGQLHTQVFDRTCRYEPQVAQGLTERVVAGASAQKIGAVTHTLMRVAPSASAISRLNRDLEQQFTA